jgi:allantoate deiminase
VGFAEEEGVRFGSAYLGSKGFAGRLRAADLGRRDDAGVSVEEALQARDPGFALPSAGRAAKELLGYVETHIEQGPILEQRRLPVGVVTAIAGQIRGRAVFVGKAGHAGTTPMGLRKDALAGAAEWIGWIERYAAARRRAPLVATVGTIAVRPGAPNVISAAAMLSLDVRHPADRRLRSALAALVKQAKAIARRRGLKFSWEMTQRNGAVQCDPGLTAALKASVRAAGFKPIGLVSGAGHDGVVMSQLTPTAMLFVRCRSGLSHHPDEYASPADITAALRVLCDFLRRLAAAPG